jgi:flagellar FliL protein
MSAAAAAAQPKAEKEAADAVPVVKGKKKLVIIIAAVAALVLAAGGGGAFYIMKKRAAAAAAASAEGEDSQAASSDAHDAHAPKADLKHAPTFVPLDLFTVNLADRDAERYAQVGITLELLDAKAGDLLKAYMPAIRNNILLVLASKTAGQLMDHEGKLQLAAEIRAATLKPLGYVIAVPRPAAAAAAGADKGDVKLDAKPPKPVMKPAIEEDPDTPVRAVHFSNFIIQ